jgi:hemoglobin
MRIRYLTATLLVATSGAIVFACGGGKKPPPKEPTITETVSDAGDAGPVEAEAPKPKSLFERLGGKEAIAKVVDIFIKNVAADAKINKRFAKLPAAKMEKLKTNLVDQICEATGGDCKYTGKGMKEVHKGMKIKDDEWNALVADLKSALEEAKVPEAEQGDLMSLLGPMKDDIVEVPAKGAGKPPPKK